MLARVCRELLVEIVLASAALRSQMLEAKRHEKAPIDLHHVSEAAWEGDWQRRHLFESPHLALPQGNA